MKARFAVYPGTIRSQNDGDVHHIGFGRLCQLYGVPPALCVDMSREECHRGMDASGLIQLHPRTDGHYVKPLPLPVD